MDDNPLIKEALTERIIDSYNFKLKYRLMLKKKVAISKIKIRNDF